MKFNRAVVALLGAGAMILFGVYPNQTAAIHGSTGTRSGS